MRLPRGVLALLFAHASVRSAAQPVLGVPRGEWDAYRGDTFTCKDGSATIPIRQLNDDYCDCEDGTDEPGTSACASHGGRFFCENRGYRSKYVRASIVNDGICDCCDGSEEHASGAGCPNNCVEAGAYARAEAEARVRIVSAGLKTATEWSDAASATRSGWSSEVDQLRRNLEEKQKAAAAIEAEKKVAEEKESVLREAFLAKKAIENEEKRLKDLEAKAAEAAAASVPSLVCVSWRQTGDCKGDGEREPAKDSA